jgi:hypothetical protein
MNRWYAAAILILVAALATAVLMPGLPDCPSTLNECDGFQLSPTLVVLAGVVIAGVVGFLGFVRSTK